LLIIDYFVEQGALLLFCFIAFPIECRWCATPATHIVILNSSRFRGILNGKYDLVIIDFHATK